MEVLREGEEEPKTDPCINQTRKAGARWVKFRVHRGPAVSLICRPPAR
jgi:hypothetical protein